MMTSESEKKPQARKIPAGTGIAIGAALGVAFGALYERLGLSRWQEEERGAL